jgi:hypothetical protein
VTLADVSEVALELAACAARAEGLSIATVHIDLRAEPCPPGRLRVARPGEGDRGHARCIPHALTLRPALPVPVKPAQGLTTDGANVGDHTVTPAVTDRDATDGAGAFGCKQQLGVRPSFEAGASVVASTLHKQAGEAVRTREE